ncbi:MAG: PQQ-like beta-propeller repeat protein [Rubripirellula sp.]|nr:PQQ-like beta-propeller repeat protein [Rubripirellula sp.]
MNTFIRRPVLSLSIVALLLTPLPAEDWFRWRGPNLDGISAESGWDCDWPDGNAVIAWRATVGIGFSSAVVAQGRVFTIGHVDGHDEVHAINESDGTVGWRFQYPATLDDRDFEGGPTSTPTVDGDHVYVLSRAGELFCLSVATGELIWQQSVAEQADVRLPGWGCSAAPLVLEDRLLLNIGAAGAAVDKKTGELIWSSEDRESGYATPVVLPDSDPPAAVFASGKAYVAVEIKTGRQLWSERWLTSFNCNAADPIISGQRMFLSSGYNRGAALFELGKDDPELIWKSKEMKNQIHGSILYKGHLYGLDGDMESGARLRCMDWETGEIRWSEDDLRPGGLTLAGGRLIVLTEAGELVVSPADAAGWRPIAKTKVANGKCWTGPVLSNGRIYCRTVQGELVCVDCRS